MNVEFTLTSDKNVNISFNRIVPVVSIGSIGIRGPAGDPINIAHSIDNGDSTHAPDGNSVYDALALKAPLVSPSFTTPALGTPASGNLENCSGYPITPVTFSTAAEIVTATETDKAIPPDQLKLAGIVQANIANLKPAVNAAVNKLDIFTKSGGTVPDSTNIITVAIPDANGYTSRTRAAAYLSGTSQIIMADAGNYWSKGSLDAEIKTAWLYAIWDGTGIVWALAGYSGFTIVTTTTTPTDDDYFLLEDGSTYTRSASHFCVAVAKIRYQYDTADTPDHTIQATGENIPQVIWNAKSDYGYQKNMASTVSSGSDITEASRVSLVVKQSGKYRIEAHEYGSGSTVTTFIKTGSATYGSAFQKARSKKIYSATVQTSCACYATVYLNAGDTIHLGAEVLAGSGTRYLYGDDTSVGVTTLNFARFD